MLKGLQKAQALKEFRGLRVVLTEGGLKGVEKARSLKRFRELRVLLGGSSSPNTDLDWQAKFIAEADAFGKNIAGYVGASTSQFAELSILAQQPEGSWMATKLGKDLLINVFYTLPNGKYGGGDGRDELQAAYDVAMTARNQHLIHLDRQDSALLGEPTNPLYQSVIDGAPITRELLVELQQAAQQEAEPTSNSQLTQATTIALEFMQGMVQQAMEAA